MTKAELQKARERIREELTFIECVEGRALDVWEGTGHSRGDPADRLKNTQQTKTALLSQLTHIEQQLTQP